MNKQYVIKKRPELVWDDNMDMRLKHLRDAKRSVKCMANIFKCSELIIHRRLRVLNLTENKWTVVQDRLLKQNYLMHTNKELVRLVGTNQEYVRDRLAYLKLVRPRSRKSEPKNLPK